MYFKQINLIHMVTPTRYALLSPLYRWGNWGFEKLSILIQTMPLARASSKIWIWPFDSNVFVINGPWKPKQTKQNFLLLLRLKMGTFRFWDGWGDGEARSGLPGSNLGWFLDSRCSGRRPGYTCPSSELSVAGWAPPIGPFYLHLAVTPRAEVFPTAAKLSAGTYTWEGQEANALQSLRLFSLPFIPFDKVFSRTISSSSILWWIIDISVAWIFTMVMSYF